MGYKYENKLDQLNADEYWRGKPVWLRRSCFAAGAVFAALFLLLGLTATVVPIWQAIEAVCR